MANCIEAKKVLRYVKGEIDYDLFLDTDEHQPLEGFVDADWAGEVQNWILTRWWAHQMVLQEANERGVVEHRGRVYRLG